MSLEDRAREAREKADRSIDPCDHMVANALEGVIGAEEYARKFASPAGDTSDLPPWSEVSRAPDPADPAD